MMKKKAKDLVHDLITSATEYRKGIDPKPAEWSKEEEEIKSTLTTLNSFKVKQHSSMMLSLLNAYKNDKVSLKNIKWALNKIEAFHYCFNAITSQRSSGSISTNYSRIAIILSNSLDANEAQRPLKELSAFLKSRLPDEQEFLIKFRELEYLKSRTKHRPQIIYALSKLIPSNDFGLSVDYEKLTIEHLIPQSEIKSEADERIIGSIGNLILVDGKVNSDDLKNKSPIEKIRILNDINFPLSRNFIDPNIDQWDENAIKNRTDLIAHQTYNYIANKVLK